MAKKDTASKQRAEAARFAINLQRFFDANARFAINLQRAFNDLCVKLNHAYGQPADDAAEMRTQHVLALLAIAGFLDQMGGPVGYLADFADQFAKLAQALQDVHAGISAPVLTPATASRGDQTLVWLARAHVALAVETKRRCGDTREDAARWAAKKHPSLKKLITESGPHLKRGKSLEKAILSWCENFSSRKIRNEVAARTYFVALDNLKAWASNCNSDQMKAEADRLLQRAVALPI